MSYIGNQPVPQSLESRQEFTATASQTTFATSGYTVGYVDVYLNGVKLSTSDFTATNGSDIVLGSGAAAGDVLAVVMKNDHSDLVALPITDSAGNNVLSESGGVVTLTADAAVIEGSSSGDLVRITQTGSGNALVVEDSANPDSTPFVVDSSGNVGIGTSTPSYKLDITGPGTASASILRLNDSDSASTADSKHLLLTRGASTAYVGIAGSLVLANNPLILSRSGNYDLRIDSNGTVFFGGGYAPDPNTKIAFNATPTVAGLATQNTSLGAVNKVATFRANNTTEIGHITCDNTSTSFSTASDYRLKENFTEITDGISRVKQLNPLTFNFISDPDKIVDGFIAHEAAEIVPEAVTGTKDAVDDEGNPEYQGVDYGRITPLLTAALKEAIAKIEMLETRIALLEAK
jgi:hypothetical protein